MTEHLSIEEIKLLAEPKLKGAERVRVLLHLEDCEDCRKRIQRPSKQEILRRLLPDINEKVPE